MEGIRYFLGEPGKCWENWTKASTRWDVSYGHHIMEFCTQIPSESPFHFGISFGARNLQFEAINHVHVIHTYYTFVQ